VVVAVAVADTMIAVAATPTGFLNNTCWLSLNGWFFMLKFTAGMGLKGAESPVDTIPN